MSHQPETSQQRSRRVPTSRARELALAAAREGATVTNAAKAAGVDRRTLLRWRSDPEFAESWSDAWDEGADVLYAEAWRRATEGRERQVVSRAGQVVTVQDAPSDRLLELMLKSRRPDEFRERSEVRHDQTPQISREELESIRETRRDPEKMEAILRVIRGGAA